MLPLRGTQAVIAKNFDHTDSGNCRSVLGDELAESGMFRLGGVNDDVTVQEHHSSLPGKGRSVRSSRCQASGSARPSLGASAANFSSAAAIRFPCSAGEDAGGGSSSVTNTLTLSSGER